MNNFSGNEMKNIIKCFYLLFLVAIITACSKKEEKLELFSAEAFAYSMDSGWELNATCRVKGFTQKEETEQFKAKLSFTVDIQTPDGKILAGVGKGMIDKTLLRASAQSRLSRPYALQ